MGFEAGNTKTVAKTSSDANEDAFSSSGASDPSSRQLSEDAPLSAKETIAVNRSKILVYAALLLAAVAVGTTTYILLSRGEEEDFEIQFRSFAREIIDVASSNAGAVFTDATIMSTAITAYALTSNATWPFVTVPFFERRLDDGAVELGERHPTIFCPLITEDQIEDWEDYAAQNQGWIRDGLKFHGARDVDPGPMPRHVHPLQVVRSRRYHEHGGGQGLHEDEKGDHGDEHEEEGAHGGEQKEDSHERHEDNHKGERAAHDDNQVDKEEAGSQETQKDHLEEEELGNSGETDHHGHVRLRRLQEGEHEGEGHDEHAEGAAAEEGGGGGGGHDDHHHHHHGPVEIDFAAAPIWQVDPAPHNVSVINGNVLSNDMLKEIVAIITFEKHQILSEAVDIFGHQDHDSSEGDEHHHAPDDPEPHSYLIQPVFDSFGTFDEKNVVGVLLGEIAWGAFFDRILPEGLDGFVVVVSDKCQTFQTFVVNGPKGKRLGAGQLHDPKYDYMRVQSAFATEASRSDIEDDFKDDHCHYQMDIYPSDEFRSRYISNKPVVYTTVVVLVFVCTIIVFVVYDWFVQRRQARLVKTAKRTNAIVSSIFPRDVQRRMMEEAEQQEREENHKRRGAFGFAPRSQLKDFLDDGNDGKDGQNNGLAPAAVSKVKPIADLFPEVTIMFADIVGFTAWSSTREPPQVFMLLESIYHSFDYIAKQRHVFKVETVGDCYVAVAGLPDPRKDHCLVMARFARDCVMKLSSLVKQLEVQLGPDTADIGMRFGLNSGQVTAGVLRGQRARFQLFGDTMNVAARMESTGERNRIQVTGATADLLRASGKGHWVTPRNGLVSVKGKGELQTYWVFIHQRDYGTSSDCGSAADTESACSSRELDPVAMAPSKIQRLADWNTTNLLSRLKSIVARRTASGTQPDAADTITALEEASLQARTTVLEETTEIVRLPHFDPKAAKEQKDPRSIQLSDEVIAETSNFVMTIAEMYRSDNPFHNFEHASHVTQSTEKFLSRIVAPDLTDKVDAHDNFDSALDDHTYGITSDPWTQFTVVLSALIHDVDHPGVPNSTLIKEKSAMAAAYNNKSIAESNSVDLAWELLMDEQYKNLRRQIYCTEREFHHFRSLLVNTVLATDIMDKELSGLRKARWNKAFSEEGVLLEDAKVTKDRKATIVIEHIIQASDVAHTMQHWHIYTKWNRRLFEELYLAYIDGRSEKDPSDGWYEGEIGFLDFYVIPLAKKLQSCGVFGVSSSECLTYAELNREEWQRKGKEVVESMIEDVKSRVTAAGHASSLNTSRHDWERRGAELVESKKVDFTRSFKSAPVSTTSEGSEVDA